MICEARVDGVCRGWPGVHRHHRQKRSLGKPREYSPENLMRVCVLCHTWIEVHPLAAHELGLTIWSWEELTPKMSSPNVVVPYVRPNSNGILAREQLTVSDLLAGRSEERGRPGAGSASDAVRSDGQDDAQGAGSESLTGPA